MPLPVDRHVEVLGPEPYTMRLAELGVPEDKDSSDPGLLPTFNPYAADGDVTAEVVFVNYGIPEDYEKLAELGISVEGKIVLARYGRSWRGIKAKLAQGERGAGRAALFRSGRGRLLPGAHLSRGPLPPQVGGAAGLHHGHAGPPGRPADPGLGRQGEPGEADPRNRPDPGQDPGPADLLGRRPSHSRAAPRHRIPERRLEGGAADHLPHRSRSGDRPDADRLRLAGAAHLQRDRPHRGLHLPR